MPSTRFITVDVDLDHLAEVVYVRVLYCKAVVSSLFGSRDHIMEDNFFMDWGANSGFIAC